jgi:hypothetical protein
MDNFENTLVNLRVIHSLQCHERLDTTQPLFKIHQPLSWVPVWAKRWWAAQTRRTDISRIHTLYQQSIHFVNTNHEHSMRIIEYIRDSKSGLKNLKTTYEQDSTVVAQINVIIDTVNDLLTSFEISKQTND